MRKSVASLKAKSSIPVNKLYPVADGNYDNGDVLVKDMKTIGISLTKPQAIEVATSMLVAASYNESITLTGHRTKNRLTITSP